MESSDYTQTKVERLGFMHRELLQERLKKIDTRVSEYTFPNLYLFRGIHEYEVVYGKELLVRGKAYDGSTYLMPTADVDELDLEYVKSVMGGGLYLFPIPEDRLGRFGPGEFQFEAKKSEMDYIYSVQKFSTYAGRRLHKKRNLLKQFVESYEHEALPLNAERMDDARMILEKWKGSFAESPDGTDDYEACREALGLYDELVLCGGIYYAEGEPAGFIIGEELDARTFVLHFAKARVDFKGIYQYMFQNFAQVLPEKYDYLNLEPDLGLKQLRLAKRSYQPDVMLKKYRVWLR